MAHGFLVLLIVFVVILALLGALFLFYLVVEMTHVPEREEEREVRALERRARQLERETDELGHATRNALLREAHRRANYQHPEGS